MVTALTTLIPLCVPFERRKEAARGGATFNGEQKCWMAQRDKLDALLPFVPYRYRPDRKPPYIRPWMVPQALWGFNLRAFLAPEDWNRIRKDAYARAGSRCRVCGGRGPQWPVEADEGWAYDDERRIQTLKGVISLCPDCHGVRHWGKTMTEGRQDAALAWMAEVNGWSRSEAARCGDQAMKQWHTRSRHTDWQCDISWAIRTDSVVPIKDGETLARELNRKFVQQAQSRVGVKVRHATHIEHLIGER